MAPIPSSEPWPATAADTPRHPSGASPPSDSRRGLLVLLLALPLLHLTNPLAWGQSGPALWWPSAGLGLALIAWFGARAALCVALDGLLVVAQVLLWGGAAGIEPLREAADAVLGAAVMQVSWWLYHDRARGARGLADPRSAMLFLFLVPGLGVGAWAALHALLTAEWQSSLTVFWLGRSLGVMVLTPWLLVVLTPWLCRRGLVRPEAADGAAKGPLDMVGADERLTHGDVLEMVGLAAGAGVLSWLAMQGERSQTGGWQLWGTPLLLIVWASLRQGLRGSTLVAAVSAGLPLLLLGRGPAGEAAPLLLESNLLSQCVVALLVASSASWVRRSEERYRQVMAHVPVVIYSARFLRPERPPRPVGDLAAEVTLVSAGSLALLHCPPEELLGDHQRWLDRAHPDDRELLRAAIAQVGRQEQPIVCEYRLARCEAGSAVRGASTAGRPARWVRDTLAPCRDADGLLVGWDGVLTDITPQRVLADDLRRTTSMLHALVGNLPAGVFFVQGPSGHPILVNTRARQLLGQREDMAAGLDHLSEVYRLHRPDGSLYPVEELPVYAALRKGLTTMREDIVVHRPDGRRIPLVTWAAPVALGRNGPGNGGPSSEPGAAVWVLEDLTALHQAEAARRDTEIRLRAVFETMAEALLVLDQDGVVVDCNTAAGTLFGHPPERLRGMAPREADWSWLREDGAPLPPEESAPAIVLRMGRPVRNLVLGIVRTMPADGRPPKPDAIRWLLVNAMPLGAGTSGEGRSPAGVVVTYVDITASVQARKMVRESEERYRELVESLPLMVIQADDTLRITYGNPAMRSITGYEPGEVAEPSLWQTLVHPDDLPLMIDLARGALAGRGSRAEFRYRAKDGSEKVGLAFGEPRHRSDGTIAGTTTLIVDITRERQLEHDLLRAQRMELVGRLSSGIAHDFNNLLSVVLSLAELVGATLPRDHAALADLGRIREATEQAANLAAQLLTFSKQRRVATHRVEVNRIARRTLDLLRPSLSPRIELRADLAAGDLFIQADETQVQQVLMNLCLNARDAMPAGGLLHVQTELRPGEPSVVCLSVSDQGTGMTEEVKAHLFDPFFSTKDRGTGLGLAVVRQIVESHGGRVEFTSEPDCGSRFDVCWPFVEDESR